MACVGVGAVVEFPAATGTAVVMVRVARVYKSVGMCILTAAELAGLLCCVLVCEYNEGRVCAVQ